MHDCDVPDESFLMVSQTSWEDDIFWDDGEETKQKVRGNNILEEKSCQLNEPNLIRPIDLS